MGIFLGIVLAMYFIAFIGCFTLTIVLAIILGIATIYSFSAKVLRNLFYILSSSDNYSID